jgi:hypothetical protein
MEELVTLKRPMILLVRQRKQATPAQLEVKESCLL